jgi:nucleotide-binding universal stress UspA family protein
MRVLLAVDGSKYAEAAGRSLVRLSSVDEVVVLHVVDPSRWFHPVIGFDMVAEYAGQMQKELHAEGERLLAATTPLIAPWARSVRSRLETGAPADMIFEVARQENADLIVIGARGLGPVEAAVLGSVSHRVISHADRPVLVIHEEMRPVRRALVPILSDEDVDDVTRLLGLAPLPQPEEIRFLTVLPLVDPLWPPAAAAKDESVQRAIAQARRFVDGAAQRVARLGYRTAGDVTLGAPAPAIVQIARDLPADLIIMGARHRGAISRFFLGSVSHGVLHRSPVAVLIAHHGAPVRAAATKAAHARSAVGTATPSVVLGG